MTVATWWWRGKTPNFGDELGPAILTRLGHTPHRVPLADAELVTVGSILELVQRGGRHGVHVWGSGLIRGRWDGSRKVTAHAVRGRLTADLLGVDVPLGDPGLLVERLWQRPRRRSGIGWVPHYVDDRRPDWADRIIDVAAPVDEVIAQIGSCDRIVSSSLHGLVVAQSWGIPAMRLPHPKVIGGDWKWVDHTTALDTSVREVQQRLLSTLPL